MIVIPMMHCQFLDVGTGKLPTAATANPGVHLKCLLTVTLFPLSCRPICFGHYFIQAGTVYTGFGFF